MFMKKNTSTQLQKGEKLPKMTLMETAAITKIGRNNHFNLCMNTVKEK